MFSKFNNEIQRRTLPLFAKLIPLTTFSDYKILLLAVILVLSKTVTSQSHNCSLEMIQLQCNYFWDMPLTGDAVHDFRVSWKLASSVSTLLMYKHALTQWTKIAKLVEKWHVLFQLAISNSSAVLISESFQHRGAIKNKMAKIQKDKRRSKQN